MRSLLATALLTLAIVGCGGEEEETTTPAPSGGDPLVTYSRSGGFAPIYEGLVIEADGDATVTTGGFRPQDQEVRELTLDEAELAALEQAVADADLAGFEPGTGVCADCYGYEIEAGGATIEFSSVDLDDEFGGVIPESVVDLIGDLNEIVRANAPRQPGVGIGG